jgi:hypothetical protein
LDFNVILVQERAGMKKLLNGSTIIFVVLAVACTVVWGLSFYYHYYTLVQWLSNRHGTACDRTTWAFVIDSGGVLISREVYVGSRERKDFKLSLINTGKYRSVGYPYYARNMLAPKARWFTFPIIVPTGICTAGAVVSRLSRRQIRRGRKHGFPVT